MIEGQNVRIECEGNWGKREASTSTVKTDLLQANLDDLDGGTELIATAADEDVLIKNLLLEEIRLVSDWSSLLMNVIFVVLFN